MSTDPVIPFRRNSHKRVQNMGRIFMHHTFLTEVFRGKKKVENNLNILPKGIK